MQLLIVDERNPQKVIRLTVRPLDGESTLSRGELEVEELRSDQLYELLHDEPDEHTLIVRSSALTLTRTLRFTPAEAAVASTAKAVPRAG